MEERGCGCGSSIAAIIILVIAALIGAGYYRWEQAQREQAQKAAGARQEIRARQLQTLADDLAEAQRWLDDGTPEMVLLILEHMEEKLVIIASAANQSGDTLDAARVTQIRQPVTDAIEAIESAEGEDEALAVARVQLEDIRKALSRQMSAQPEPARVTAPPSEGAGQGQQEERQLIRDRQIEAIAGDIEEASRFVANGRSALAVEKLQEMEEKLQLVAAAAAQAGDAAAAAKVHELRQDVRGAIGQIEDAAESEEPIQSSEVALNDLQRAFRDYEEAGAVSGE